MITFEEMGQMLDEIADQLPQEIYDRLNGGIFLSPDTKFHPQSVGESLYVLGEYRYEPHGLGRYITLFYGSIRNVHGLLSREQMIGKLRELLYHELTHHLENLAGDKGLEIKDQESLEEYRRRYKI